MYIRGRPTASIKTALLCKIDNWCFQGQYPIGWMNENIKLSNAVTLGGTYEEGGASPLGKQGHVIC